MNVLQWGNAPGPCDYFRGSQFRDEIKKHGIEMRATIAKSDSHILDADGNDVEALVTSQDQLTAKLDSGEWHVDVRLDIGDLEWADVVFFRRTYNTHYSCSLGVHLCSFRTLSRQEADDHEHPVGMVRDRLTLPVWKWLMARAEAGQDRPAIVYDTDDYLIGDQKMEWNGLWADYYAHRHIAREMASKADLVTVTTPTLAGLYRGTNRNIRVVRNAIDPGLYYTEAPRPEGDKPRLLYYGSAVRMRDFGPFPDATGKIGGGFAYRAMTELAKEITPVFLGAEKGFEKVIRAHGFTEVRPFADGIPFFAMALASTHADIGICPLKGDIFDAAKSELHWLEYSAIGAATIADKMDGKGPYSVIRDGVDGFLVRGRQDWYDAMRRLIREPNLRADMAAAAKERVLRDYDFRVRAAEWADAFKWAAEHKR